MEVGQGKDDFPWGVLLKSPLGMGTGERVQQNDVGNNRRNNEQRGEGEIRKGFRQMKLLPFAYSSGSWG